jgi:ABC-2 type transport system ATP-binding protein
MKLTEFGRVSGWSWTGDGADPRLTAISLGLAHFCPVMVATMPMAISVRGLSKSYGSIVAVNDVSFDVESGEFFGILGPNGAGKTTTMEMVEGLREPDNGDLSVLGLSPWPRNPALLPRIGVQLQASSFFERLTAREQIRTFASLYGIGARRADQMLETVGLSEHGDVRAEKLSGGQAQRLSIACALVHDPELVFMDEPTGALDPQARRNLWDLLRQINAEGRTVVLTTHHMDEAETLCDRVAIMDHGQILQLGPPAALVRGLDAPVRISVASGQLTADEASRLGYGGTPSSTVTDDGISLTIATREPAPVLAGLADKNALGGLRVQGATLEDVFLDLTGREYRA